MGEVCVSVYYLLVNSLLGTLFLSELEIKFYLTVEFFQYIAI